MRKRRVAGHPAPIKQKTKRGEAPPAAGQLSASAPVGASLRRVEPTVSGFRFTQVDVGPGSKTPVVLDPDNHPDHIKASFENWLGSHDVFHVFGSGFGSVADEIEPVIQTAVARGIIRCLRDEETGDLKIEHPRGRLSADQAQAAVQSVKQAIESLHQEDPTNSLYFLYAAAPKWRSVLTEPNMLVAATLKGVLLELRKADDVVQTLSPEMQGDLHWYVIYELQDFAKDLGQLRNNEPTDFVHKLIAVLNQVGWTTNADQLFDMADASTKKMRPLFAHEASQTINDVWLLPASRKDLPRTEFFETLLGQINSVDAALKEGAAVEWVQLPPSK